MKMNGIEMKTVATYFLGLNFPKKSCW